MENTENTQPNISQPPSDGERVTSLFPRPSVGRIVHFVEDGEVLAAMVCRVNEDGTLNLLVYGPEGQTFPRTHREFSEIAPSGTKGLAAAAGRWFWPPRA